MNAYRLFDRTLITDESFSFPVDARATRAPIRLRRVSAVPLTGAIVHDVDADTPARLRVAMDGGEVSIEHDGFSARWSAAQLEVAESAAEHRMPLEETLERVFLPLALLISGDDLIAFHGAAAAFGEHAVVFLGPSGVGKSSTLLGCTERGARILADDFALASTSPRIFPGAASVRLWRDAGTVDGARTDRPVARDTLKRSFRFDVVAERPVEPAAIVVLERTPDAAPNLRSLRGQARLSAPLAHTFDLTNGPPSWTERRMRAAAQIVRGVDAFRFSFPPSPSGHAAHVDALLDALAAHTEVVPG